MAEENLPDDEKEEKKQPPTEESSQETKISEKDYAELIALIRAYEVILEELVEMPWLLRMFPGRYHKTIKEAREEVKYRFKHLYDVLPDFKGHLLTHGLHGKQLQLKSKVFYDCRDRYLDQKIALEDNPKKGERLWKFLKPLFNAGSAIFQSIPGAMAITEFTDIMLVIGDIASDSKGGV